MKNFLSKLTIWIKRFILNTKSPVKRDSSVSDLFLSKNEKKTKLEIEKEIFFDENRN